LIEPIEQLIAQLSHLPGIGAKTAQRLALYIVSQDLQDVRALATSIYQAKKNVTFCSICGNLTDTAHPVCSICSDPRRDDGLICVVRDVRDLLAIERLHEYRGKYHVLGGTISPVDGRGPDDIAIAPLLARLQRGSVRELLLATNPDIEGEATALYIARLARSFHVRVTRIAHGVPVGGDLEYTDDVTLARAIAARREITE
jgi:recombination protein RecR